MESNFVGAAFAFAGGCLISYVNYLISSVLMKRMSNFLMVASVIRQIINVAYLAAVYFIAPVTSYSLMWLLVGAVTGLTLSMFGFTYMLVKKSDKINNSKGDEK